jgi:PhzF family phenazine biosynthesis protein
MGVINAFIDESKPFSGNPAAIIRLKVWFDDVILQQIANQNNLSETAFVVELECGVFEIRWFTPQVEGMIMI